MSLMIVGFVGGFLSAVVLTSIWSIFGHLSNTIVEGQF